MTYPPAPTYAPRRRRSPLPWIVGGVVAIAVALVAAIALGRGQAPDWRAPAAGAPAPIVNVTTAADLAPKVADMEVTPQIVKKKCFGSAGCNVTFRADLSYAGPTPDPGDTWLLIYEIRGVEDGPLVGNLKMTGTGYTGNEESVSTASSKSKITLEIVSVEKD